MALMINKVSFGTSLLESMRENATKNSVNIQTPQINPALPIQIPTPTVIGVQDKYEISQHKNLNSSDVQKSENEKIDKKSAKEQITKYAPTGLALAAVVLSVVSLIKGKKSTKFNSAIDRLKNETGNSVNSLKNDIQLKFTENLAENKYINKRIDGFIDDIAHVKAQAEDAIFKAGQKTIGVIGKSDFITQEVTVNGLKMNLVSNMHGYGKAEQSLTENLRSEATKRMLGIVDRMNITPSETVTVRVPTSEFNYSSKRNYCKFRSAD